MGGARAQVVHDYPPPPCALLLLLLLPLILLLLLLLLLLLPQVVHDYGHVGFTNDFLVASGAPLALQYNDVSPLENFHCAAAFIALQHPDHAFTGALAPRQAVALRKQVGGRGDGDGDGWGWGRSAAAAGR